MQILTHLGEMGHIYIYLQYITSKDGFCDRLSQERKILSPPPPIRVGKYFVIPVYLQPNEPPLINNDLPLI